MRVPITFVYPCVTYNGSVKDLPPNETLRGINVDVHTEQEKIEALGMLNRIAALAGRENDDDDDDDDGSNTSMFLFYDHTRHVT